MSLIDDLRLPVPPGLNAGAQRLWRHGDDTGGVLGRRETAGDPPVPGDLWILSAGEDDFGAVDLALVLVTAVYEDGRYVLCVPVTTVEQPTIGTSLLLSGSLLGIDLVLWPTLETGVSYDTLHRRLGEALDAFTLRRVRTYANGDGPAPLPTMPDPATLVDLAAGKRLFATLMDTMAVACFANPRKASA